MLSFYPSRENRPLKKPKLGPPDVYGQDARQREDELTEANLKGGFKYCVSSLDAKDDSNSALQEVATGISSGDLQMSLQDMMVVKNRGDIFSRESLLKKRPATSKEVFQTTKLNSNDSKVSTFSQDLSGASSLSAIIQKKVPVAIRKRDVFECLCNYMVPMDRASWFLKMNIVYFLNVEKKVRKTNDPSLEWTECLIEVVKKKFDYQQGAQVGENKDSPQQPQSSNAPVASSSSGEQLQYLVQLCYKLYQDGLLDKHVFLKSLVESLEQKRTNESLLSFLPLLLLFVEELLSSQFLSRSLAEFCISRLRQLSDAGALLSEEELRRRAGDGSRPEVNPVSYPLTLKLSAVLHCIILECPLALIWLPTETRSSFPLDKLPVDVTALPILPQSDSARAHDQVYRELLQRVQELRERRHAAEMKWSSVGIQASSKGAAVRELVDIIDNLDSFKFTDVTSRFRQLDLYKKVFHSPDTLQSLSLRDDTIILLLCQWAAAPDQVGRHRPLLVSGLIWARQRERAGQSVESLLNEHGEFEEELMEPSSEGRDRFPFQQALILFLDKNDSVPGSKQTASKEGAFLLLCILFSELIQREVFSFDQYLRLLVARGDLTNLSTHPSYIDRLNHHHNIEPPPSPPVPEFADASLPRDEDSLCSISSQSSSQPTDSDASNLASLLPVKEHSHLTRSNSPKPKPQSSHSKPAAGAEEETKRPNTYHYVAHFPAPEYRPKLEAQRASLLYGVGAKREFCLKVLAATREEVIKCASNVRTENQSSNKQVLKHFRLLPVCIQQEVAGACASKNIRNLLSLQKLLFIVELLDISGSVGKLIEFLFDVINMQEEESMKDCHPNIESPPTRRKPLHQSLRIPVVSLLQAYLPSLLASAYHTSLIFERLTFVFEKVKSSDHPLRSDQMRVFLFLNQLFQSCFYLMEAHKDTFGPFQKSLEHTTHSNYHLSSTDLRWELVFRQELDLQQSSQDISGTVAKLCKLIANNVIGFPSFSLICEVYYKACTATSTAIICDLAHIYADVCSEFPALNNEFMGAIRAICAPSPKNGFKELHNYILASDKAHHYKLVIFIAHVVVHNPLLLSNLVDSVMIAACQYHRSPDPSEHQSNALEITCHLILTILTEDGKLQSEAVNPKNSASTEDWHPTRRLPLYVKRFLYVQNQQLPLSSVSELLKQMLLLMESQGDRKVGKKSVRKCLEAVAGQSWVREKCQCEGEQLVLALTEKEKDVQFPGALPGLDPKLKLSQVKLLTDYICYPGRPPLIPKDERSQVMKILENLELWNLRSSLIELFVYLQLTSQLMKLTDTISNSAFQVFSQKQQEQHPEEIDVYYVSSAWLVAPLISRLPSNVHGRILKQIGDQSKGEWWVLGSAVQTSDTKEGPTSSGKQQPFLEVVLACLHSGSQEDLLDPISKQLRSFLRAPAEEKQPSDPKIRSHLNASLKLRLGLVGSLLDIARQNACYDWCYLLMQLLCSGAVDPEHTGTQELYTTTLDMLCILYRSLSHVCESKDGIREPRKSQSSLLEQLKQELSSSALTQSKCFHDLSQLIGTPKPGFRMKLFSRYNNNGFNPDDLSEYNLPGWDVLEGFPHNNNLSLTHYLKFIRHEPRPLKYEEQYRLCMLHTHGDETYTPYCVSLPEPPDISNTPIQSAHPIQDNDVITITPSESPTAKRPKKISISSHKDPKRQDSLTPLDGTRQAKLSSPGLDVVTGMSTGLSQPHPSTRRVNISTGQLQPSHYPSYVQPSDQYSRTSDKLPPYNAAAPYGQKYPMMPQQPQPQQRSNPIINLATSESSQYGKYYQPHSHSINMGGYQTQPAIRSGISSYAGQAGMQQRAAPQRVRTQQQQQLIDSKSYHLRQHTLRATQDPRQIDSRMHSVHTAGSTQGGGIQFAGGANMPGMYPSYEQTYQQNPIPRNYQSITNQQATLLRGQGQLMPRQIPSNQSMIQNNHMIQ